jgi:hypothetical protein
MEFENQSISETEKTIIESKISSEEDFRNAAEKKFKEVFGDDLDEEKMNKTIEGILKDNDDLVENGEWGKLIGILNKSFKESEENVEEPIEESCKNCKDLDNLSADELWDELGYLYKIKDEKERNERFNQIKSKISELKK